MAITSDIGSNKYVTFATINKPLVNSEDKLEVAPQTSSQEATLLKASTRPRKLVLFDLFNEEEDYKTMKKIRRKNFKREDKTRTKAEKPGHHSDDHLRKRKGSDSQEEPSRKKAKRHAIMSEVHSDERKEIIIDGDAKARERTFSRKQNLKTNDLKSLFSILGLGSDDEDEAEASRAVEGQDTRDEASKIQGPKKPKAEEKSTMNYCNVQEIESKRRIKRLQENKENVPKVNFKEGLFPKNQNPKMVKEVDIKDRKQVVTKSKKRITRDLKLIDLFSIPQAGRKW